MILTEIVYDLLLAEDLDCQIVAGYAPSNYDARDGLINFFPLPSIGSTDFASRTTSVSYQFDIWHQDMYSCEQLRDKLYECFYSRAEIYQSVPLIFTEESEDTTQDDDANLWHYTLIFNIKTQR
jgi:hypothetical protein